MFFFSFFLPFFPWAMKSTTILCNWLSVIISLYVQIDVLVVSKRKCFPTICWRPEEKIHRKPNKIRGKDPTLAFETGPLRVSRLRVVKVLWQKLFCRVSTLVHWFHLPLARLCSTSCRQWAAICHGLGLGVFRITPDDSTQLTALTLPALPVRHAVQGHRNEMLVSCSEIFSLVKSIMINHPRNHQWFFKSSPTENHYCKIVLFFF